MVAAAGEPGAAGNRGGWRLVGAALEWRPVVCVAGQGAALAVFGLINAGAVPGGAWFGRVSSPLATLLPKRY